jgi:hypothetical protein
LLFYNRFLLLFIEFYGIISSRKRADVVRFFIWSRIIARPFVITKGEKMQKVSYMGNGETTEFTFNFPYFENSNVIVTKNGEPATGYQVIGTPGGADADIPYTGGKVVFETAPTTLDSITIARSLPFTRIVDYQPLAKIEPTTMNQDANYLMEVIKDLQDELETLQTQYAEIADKESTTTLLAQIAAIHSEIVATAAQITALGDISTLRSSVATNTGDITTLKGYDYVVASQLPTADNNYTWYRKYKSGWVEQGGYAQIDSTNGIDVTMPLEMLGTKYQVLTHVLDDTQTQYVFEVQIKNQTRTGFHARMIASYNYGSWVSGYNFGWHVSGMTA